MRVTQERNVVVVAIIAACVLASALWPAVAGSHAALPRLIDDIASAGETPILSALAATAKPARPRANEDYGKLPLSFEVNQGQTDSRVKFLSRASGYDLFLTATEAVFRLPMADGRLRNERTTGLGNPQSAITDPQSERSAVLRMRLLGANATPEVTGLDQLPGKTNYFLGSDHTKWHPNVSTYSRVQYTRVYPGIDLVYYGSQRQLEYDFHLAPGTDSKVIRLAFKGARHLRVDEAGDLVLDIAGAQVRYRKPEIYQELNGDRKEIGGGYVIMGRRRVGFRVGRHDPSLPLTIDPVLVYSTYLGGSFEDEGHAIAVDSAGNAYVTGSTSSPNFPTANSQSAYAGNTDAFVTKLNASGTALVYSTYMGDEFFQSGEAIAVDASGNAYVTGEARIGSGAVNAADVLILKLDPTGALTYIRSFGGSLYDTGSAIAVDSVGNIYVMGRTSSTDFPTTASAFQTGNLGGEHVFVAKVNPEGTSLLYSTMLGGSNNDVGKAIAADAAGNVYVTGYTASNDFPISQNAFQRTRNTGGFPSLDAFVAKLNTNGSGAASLVYSTFLGGDETDAGNGIAIDAAGNAYVTGYTGQSSTFPTIPGAFKEKVPFSLNRCSIEFGRDKFFCEDAFVTKINPIGTGLVYSTLLGGRADERGLAIALDGAGNAYVTGTTNAPNFPVTPNAFQPALGGFIDAFVTELNSTGSALVYSSYFGGGRTDEGRGIAVDSSGNAYVVGNTDSNDLLITANAVQPNYGGPSNSFLVGDAFVAKIQGTTTPPPTPTPTPTPSSTPQWQPVVLTAQQIDQLKAWTLGGSTSVYVRPKFPDAGYRIVSFGLPTRTGNDFTVNASVEKFTGTSIQAVVTTAQIYDLGTLTNGTYNFNFKTSGTLAKTLQFTVGGAAPPPNPIDDQRQFVRQQYLDFLNREPDVPGSDFWTDNITKCSDASRRPPLQTESECVSRQRETTSAAFFISPEFQNTGYFVLRVYRGSLGRFSYFGGSVPVDNNKDEFTRDHATVSAGIVVNNQLDAGVINANKQAFVNQFVTRSEFLAIYGGLNNDQYVDKLFATTGVVPTDKERGDLVSGLNANPATETRASVLFKIVDGTQTVAGGALQFQTRYGQVFYQQQFNPAFVQIEYFGYMRRDPDDAGYAFWLGKLNQFNGNFVNAEMVLAFISSPEYRARFGQP